MKCRVCGINDVFCKSLCKKCYHSLYMKECRKIPEFKEKEKEYAKGYVKGPKRKAYLKEYNQRPEVIARKKEYQQRPEVKARKKEYSQRPEVKKRKSEYMRTYQKKPERKEYMNIYMKTYIKDRRSNDINYKLIIDLRSTLNRALKLYSTTGKIMPSKKYGIDYKKIIEHLKPFPKDIKNYDVDHIMPLSRFDLDNPKEIKWAFEPENHQWLLKSKNRSKGNKFLQN